MMFSSTFRALLTLFAILSLLVPGFASGPKPIRPGDPVLSIPLEDLGFETPAPRLLISGATLFTVNFVDNTHILLTYHTHGLIPRLPDEPPDDDDRLVNALLLELPSGKILARTRWHTHDRQQYLWPLSNGMFLLRIRNKLSVIDPLRELNTAEPFRQQAFLTMDRPIGFISTSPGGDLLIIETVPPVVREGDDMGLGGPEAHPRLNTGFTAIHFFRLITTEKPGERAHLTAQSAGIVNAHGLVRIPANADGFLDISKESPQTWLFDFQSHAGAHLELAPFDTSCTPSPFFISRSEFVAFGCHGDRIELGGFNFHAEQPWVSELSGQQIAPYITSAPAAGRIVFSRVLVAPSFLDIQNLTPDELTAQEIKILQSHDGRTLLKVQASPIQRAGQNYDVSADGLNFTVIRNGNLELYRLPPLTPKDEEEIARSAAATPDKNEARINLATQKKPAPAEAESAKSPAFTVAPATQTAAPAAPSPATEGLDLTPNKPDEPSAPPSLYTPEYPKKPPGP